MKALFKEKNGSIGGALINVSVYNNRKNINIYTYNEKGFQTGRINVIQIYNNEYYIADIYCYSMYRGNGIATKILKLVETIIEPNTVITGTFVPYQDRSDRYTIPEYNKLFSDVRDFYANNGYEFYKSKGTIKFKKHITFKEDNFALAGDVMYDVNLCNKDFELSEQLIKKISKR